MLAGVACLLGAAYLGVNAHQASIVSEADELSAAGHADQAITKARQASNFPAAGRADLVEAYALAQLGDYEASARAYERAAQREPSNWVIRRDWAIALERAGEGARSREQLNRAMALNPLMDPAGLLAR